MYYAARLGLEGVVADLLSSNPIFSHDDGSLVDSFVVAAAMGHEAVSCLLLKHGADINGGGQRSRTPLTAAAIRGNEVVVRFLVANSADINPQNGKLMPPMAALAGSTEAVVRFLVRNGADVNYQDGTSYTPLTATVLVNDEEMVRLLIDNGADVNADCAAVLQVAKKQGYRSIAKPLMEHGAKEQHRHGRLSPTLSLRV